MDERVGLAHNSPALAVDPTEERIVASATRRDSPDFGCALHISGDGGSSWLPADPVPKLPDGVEKCYGPEVAFDAEGRLYFLFVGLAGAGNSPVGSFLVTSTGGRFSTPRRVLGPERYMVRMAVDQRSGRLHLVWVQAGADPPLGGFAPGPNPIMASYSDDGGQTFSEPVQVNEAARQRVVAPAIAVGSDGAVHVAYYDLVDDSRDYQGLEGPKWENPWSLVVSGSDNGGRTFGRHTVVDDALVPPERVMLVFTMPPPSIVAGNHGEVFTAWHDARNGDWDVFLSRSPDRGGTWSAARRLNDDPKGNGRHQYLPRLSLAPNGRLDTVFYDRRSDPQNLRNDVFFTSSAPGTGGTFSPNLQITADPSDSRIGPRYPIPSARGMVEFGSRLGLVSLDGGAVAAWTDTRNSQLESPQQDVFATTVDLGSEPKNGSGGVSVVFVLAGAAIFVAVSTLFVRQRQSRRPAPVGAEAQRGE
ncbi:MAG TPA: sialidase family protein [Acidimicrobiales bacterium]|nr:sialidase family protein [Acidimicrobiales bacterium]